MFSNVPNSLLDTVLKQKLEELIAEFKAITPTLYYTESRISFLLALVEDAVSRVQGNGQCPCDQTNF